MVRGGFSGDSEKCGKPADARVSRGSGVSALRGRMNAATLPNRNRKLFSDVSNDFSSFPLVFRYSPTWIDGKKHARNVYAHTREECEEKLKVLIAEMKAELAELKRQKDDRH